MSFFSPSKNSKLDILKRAQKEKWAIGQFNISNLETLRAILEAAKALKSPVIIGTSEGESKFIGLKQAVALVKAFREETGVPAFLNLDHGKDLDYIKKAIVEGYDLVHFDGSKLSFEENVRNAREIMSFARKRGVLVEGEVGFIKGASEILDSAPEIKEGDLTSSEDALNFVKETGVCSLAVNVGTFHGVSKKEGEEKINFERLKEINGKISNRAFLVLHGGSGIGPEGIKKAIELGIVKININTDLRIVFTNTLRSVLSESAQETTPYKYMPKVIAAVQKAVEDKIKLFNSVNKI